MQSVQEGLSQILNPAQTFYNTNSNPGANNTSSSGNSAPDPHKQTPTFTQHMSKIIIENPTQQVVVTPSQQSNMLARKRSSINFDRNANNSNEDLSEKEITRQRQQQAQLQEQFMKYYVSPRSTSSNNNPTRVTTQGQQPIMVETNIQPVQQIPSSVKSSHSKNVLIQGIQNFA